MILNVIMHPIVALPGTGDRLDNIKFTSFKVNLTLQIDSKLGHLAKLFILLYSPNLLILTAGIYTVRKGED